MTADIQTAQTQSHKSKILSMSEIVQNSETSSTDNGCVSKSSKTSQTTNPLQSQLLSITTQLKVRQRSRRGNL